MEQWAAGESPVYLNSNSNGASKHNIKHTIEHNYRYTLDYDLGALFFELEFTTSMAPSCLLLSHLNNNYAIWPFTTQSLSTLALPYTFRCTLSF